MITVGIDPGASGAVAFLLEDGRAYGELADTNDGRALAELIHAHMMGEWGKVGLEAVHSFPGQGVASTFKFGAAFGTARGVVQAMGLPLVLVTPQAWTRRAFRARAKPAGKKARKLAALQAARERWPDAHLDRIKDGAIAEALWIALVVREMEAL